MKISYRRTGGFAGMVISFEVETDSLSADDAVELQKLVAFADFFALPAEIISNSQGADQFHYTLTVETEQQHSVDVGDAAVPENLWPLINKLRLLSRANQNQ